MRKVFSTFTLFLLVAFAAMAARAQKPTPTISFSAWVDKGECTGVPNFEPTIDGKPASIKQVLDPNSDQIILIVLDLTGDLSRVDEVKQALINDISKLPPNVWVGLLRAQDGLHVLADPSPDRQKAIDAIRSLPVSGTPGLLGTLRPALSLADAMIKKAPVRVSLFYITDGSIYDYREDYTDPVINPSDNQDLSRRFRDVLVNEKISKLDRHLSSLEAPFFVIQLHYRQNSLDQAYQNGLETLTRTTGGEADICHSIAEIPEAVSRIFARITSAWWVTLAVPGKRHSHLEIGLNASCGKGNLQLSWRSHFDLKGG